MQIIIHVYLSKQKKSVYATLFAGIRIWAEFKYYVFPYIIKWSLNYPI
jgi:hypothetical protein